MHRRVLGTALALAIALPASAATWRGDGQDGVFPDGSAPAIAPTGPPLSVLWKSEVSSRATPVFVDDRVYVFGYVGEGPELREGLWAYRSSDGTLLWQQTWRDFLSDIIYDRYSIGAPSVDPTTGAVYVQSSNGVLHAFTADGAPMWEVSMMEAFGRLTFPNGRTGSPIVLDDLVIVHGITAFWGGDGPARDRFHAFDKATGELVWSSTPGTPPKDSSYSTPVIEVRGGRTILYAGTGCGNLVAVDAHTGEPIWRHAMSLGGVNVSPVLVGDLLIASHAKESIDSSKTGGTVALDLAGTGETGVAPRVAWTSDLSGFSSSPVAHDGVVYQVDPTGTLHAVDATTGASLWEVALAPDQLHASPAWADGHLWVPMHDGSMSIVEGGRDGGTVVAKVQLPGKALGAPAMHDGLAVVTTTDGVLAFGTAPDAPAKRSAFATATSDDTPATLRVRPAELLLRPGDRVALRADVLNAAGQHLKTVDADDAETWIPPTAKVAARMDARFEDGAIVTSEAAQLSAGAWKVEAAGLEGVTRGRVVVGLPYREAFDDDVLDGPDGAFGWPPLPWIGARFKWQIRDVDGERVFAKTLDTMIFQRSTVFVGDPDARAYEVVADVRADGDRRMISTVGLVNSRYLIQLKGAQRVLEVASNQERLKESVPFRVEPGVWYRLRTQVIPPDPAMDVTPTPPTLVRAKVWKRGEPEPDAWTITVTHEDGHDHGAPGLFGFSPRNLHAVYFDNLEILPIEEAR